MDDVESDFNELLAEAKTPDQAGFELMAELEELWIAVAPNKSADDFETEIAAPFHDEVDIEQLEEDFADVAGLDRRELGSWPLIERPILIAYGYAVMVRLASACRASDLAWGYVAKSSFWHGLSLGLARIGESANEPVTINAVAKKAAHARNAENRALMAFAFEWLDKHYAIDCKSMDHAAELLQKVVPVAFRTARRYVDKWNLSRPSARSV
jgi:hypothetical protein